MSFQTPKGKCSINIKGLGRLDGWEYIGGVQQFCGIPYATLPKRWTRSTLKTSWAGDFHDGTRRGNDCPRPGWDYGDCDELTPVPQQAHLPDRGVQEELTGLVMNITAPSGIADTQIPVLVYVHGGSLLYGGANLPIFDAVNLVTHSIAIGKPIICVNFNYRVGIGGFLASKHIANELRTDGHQGCGNFGFTDQQVAFEWVQKYISQFGGDASDVTAVGESAGGISISNQLLAAHHATFHRAVCMSGLAMSIPAWTMQQHEQLFQAVCDYFSIDSSSPEVLDQLRQIPQEELANATPAIQGVGSGTGNPCIDGYFYARDPLSIHDAPSWMKAYMFGDTYHEAVIFHLNIMSDSYEHIRETLGRHIADDKTLDEILALYEISSDLPQADLIDRVEHMCGDAVFKVPNFATALANKRLQSERALYTYHVDQRSRLNNVLEGTSYHAIDLLYLFGNLTNEMDESEKGMVRDFMTAWIKFTYGEAPWEAPYPKWKIWGQKSRQIIVSEDDDDELRQYGRMRKMLEMGGGEVWKKWVLGVDALVNKRSEMGKAKKVSSRVPN